MPYKMTPGDVNAVSNLRFRWKDRLAPYADEHIAKRYREWSGSDDYPNEETFIEHWLLMN